MPSTPIFEPTGDYVELAEMAYFIKKWLDWGWKQNMLIDLSSINNLYKYRVFDADVSISLEYA
jgi:hypothetical protein